jgi:hypothetical protein
MGEPPRAVRTALRTRYDVVVVEILVAVHALTAEPTGLALLHFPDRLRASLLMRPAETLLRRRPTLNHFPAFLNTLNRIAR